MRRLNRYEVIQTRRLSGIENFVSKRDDFIFNSFRNLEPVKRFQNRSDVLEFWSLDNSSSKSILDVLETIYLKFRKTIVTCPMYPDKFIRDNVLHPFVSTSIRLAAWLSG